MGLIERKERPKVKEEPSPEQGSQLYQTEYTETKRFEHEAFLTDVVGKPAGDKHIAIIGEPGAGKTTILTKIGAWLIQQAEQQPPAPLVVAWISLADVGDRRLQTYLRAEWLQKVCEDNFDVAWENWKRLRQQGRVWLLLDGLDEMSGDALAAIHRDLGLAWARNLRVAMTCRINQWETAAGGNILSNSFDVYRTLDYSYQTSQGEDQVEEFISKWFVDNQKVATQIRTELDAPGKERVKDLVKNPLRLTLLCASWEKDDQALPETKANLYRGFVNYLYKWKAAEFEHEVKLRQELDLALGELAKAGLNRASINNGAVRRFRFTASEISELWADLSDTLLPAAKNLGWLNVVGEEAGEAVYAFYHPTFQEYFAATSVNGWHFFLNHFPDSPNHPDASYRVFESRWKEVYLLWLGQDKILKEDKEHALSSLVAFNDTCDELYKYKAFLIAALGVAEFGSYSQAESIVKQIVNWYFGYIEFQLDNELTVTFHSSMIMDDLVKTALKETNRQPLIKYLSKLANTSSYESTRRDAVRCLREIGYNDRKAIQAMIELTSNADKQVQQKAIENLGEIGKGKSEVIEVLNSCLLDADEEGQFKIAKELGKIDLGNKNVIQILMNNLLKCDDSYDSRQIAYVIQKVDINNECCQAFENLLQNVEEDRARLSLSEKLIYIKPDNLEAAKNLNQILESDAEDELKLNAAGILLNNDSSNTTAIYFLIHMLQNNCDIEARISIIKFLGLLTSNNPTVITSFNMILKIDKENKILVAISEFLKDCAIENKESILALTTIMNETEEPHLKCHFAESLGEIDPGNSDAIDVLISYFDTMDSEESKIYAIERFSRIGDGNSSIVQDKLSKIINENWTARVLQEAGWNLWIYYDIDREKIYSFIRNVLFNSTEKEAIGWAARRLKIILNEEIISDVVAHMVEGLRNNAYADKRDIYKIYFDLAIYCVERMPYLDFYRAWNDGVNRI